MLKLLWELKLKINFGKSEQFKIAKSLFMSESLKTEINAYQIYFKIKYLKEKFDT